MESDLRTYIGSNANDQSGTSVMASSATHNVASTSSSASPADSIYQQRRRYRYQPSDQPRSKDKEQLDDIADAEATTGFRSGQVDRGVPGLERVALDGNQQHSPKTRRSVDHNDHVDEDGPSFPSFAGDRLWSQRSWAYQFIPFRGMWYDVRRRLPYYTTDWTATFLPRNWWTVAQAVVRIYFIK